MCMHGKHTKATPYAQESIMGKNNVERVHVWYSIMYINVINYVRHVNHLGSYTEGRSSHVYIGFSSWYLWNVKLYKLEWHRRNLLLYTIKFYFNKNLGFKSNQSTFNLEKSFHNWFYDSLTVVSLTCLCTCGVDSKFIRNNTSLSLSLHLVCADGWVGAGVGGVGCHKWN